MSLDITDLTLLQPTIDDNNYVWYPILTMFIVLDEILLFMLSLDIAATHKYELMCVDFYNECEQCWLPNYFAIYMMSSWVAIVSNVN